MPEQYDADFAPPLAHLAEQAPVSISGVQGFKNAKKDGTAANASTRGGLNFVTGSNITLTVADDSANDEVDVTIAAADAEYDVLTKVTTAVTVVNTVTETNLVNYTIPAGTIGTDKTVWARLSGHFLNDSGAQRAVSLAVYLGGTTLYADEAPVSATPAGLGLGNDADRRPFVIDVFVKACGAADSQFMQGQITVPTLIGIRTPTTGYGAMGVATNAVLARPFPFSSAGRTAVDMASAQALRVTVTFEVANASLECKMEEASVAVIG